MSLRDNVSFECPECADPMSESSVVGNCIGTSYWIGSVPFVIATDIDGNEQKCWKCGCEFTLTVPKEPVVAMQIMVKK